MTLRLEQIDPERMTREVVEDNPKPLIELNKDQLYEKGEDADGKKVGKYVNDKYAAKKHRMNPAVGYGTPDGYLTGNMYQNMRVLTDSQQYEVDSTGFAYPYFSRRFPKAFGLSPVSIQEYRNDVLRPEIIKKIAAITRTGTR